MIKKINKRKSRRYYCKQRTTISYIIFCPDLLFISKDFSDNCILVILILFNFTRRDVLFRLYDNK